jgi:integrase
LHLGPRSSEIEDITKAKNSSLWRTHCEPEWGDWQMAAVTRLEAQEWVERLKGTRRARHKGKPVLAGDQDVPVISPATIHDTVHIMSQLYTAAIGEHPPLVVVNPFDHFELPRIEPRPVEFLEHDEAEALYEAAEALGAQWRTLTELGTEVGLRPGEIYGLHGHRVDWLRSQIQVIDVMTRKGLRQWPKSKKSHRVVPVQAHILKGMSALLAGRPRDGLVFTAPQGGPVTDGHFRDRVWYPAVASAGIRRFPPRIMRHTAASRLVQDGVPLYDVQALLGHEDYATTQRYAHLAPDAHGKVIESWARRQDARLTHGKKEAGPS